MVRTLKVGHMAELINCDGYGCCAASAATGDGIVTNWTDMTKITPEEHLVSLTEASLKPEEIMFLCALRRTKDAVTISGCSPFHTVPIYEACALNHAFLQAGFDFTEDLMKVVTERKYSFTAAAERRFVRVVKEKPCYTCLHFDTEYKSLAQIDMDKTDVVPDGNIITVAPNVSVARKCCLSHTVTIHEGFALHHAVFRWAGRDLAEDLMRTSQARELCHWHCRDGPRSGCERECLLHCSDYDTELNSTLCRVVKRHDHVPRVSPP